MRRSEIRENALRFLYQLSIHDEDREEQRRLFLDSFPMGKEELAYFDFLVEGVQRHKTSLDEEIEPMLIGWRFERLPILDKNILRLALFEMDFNQDVPDAVAISEAVILTKRYCDDNARSYINAVLGGLQRKRENKNEQEGS